MVASRCRKASGCAVAAAQCSTHATKGGNGGLSVGGSKSQRLRSALWAEVQDGSDTILGSYRHVGRFIRRRRLLGQNLWYATRLGIYRFYGRRMLGMEEPVVCTGHLYHVGDEAVL